MIRASLVAAAAVGTDTWYGWSLVRLGCINCHH